VGRALHAIDWHKEASREMLVLKPRRPKDLYDNGYALFAYDINVDAGSGTGARPMRPGTLAAETYAWREHLVRHPVPRGRVQRHAADHLQGARGAKSPGAART
jgi:hypothetical protein